MSTTLEQVKKLVYTEQWTRADFQSFSKDSFHEANELLKTLSEKEKESLFEFAKEHLKNNKHSIYGLYVAGMFRLEQNSIDDMYMMQLINIFIEGKKWDCVETLAKAILTFNNSLNALRVLVSVYEENKQTEKLMPIWEAIIHEDFEEADILVKLASHKAKNNDTIKEAIKDYKKAINRYLLKKDYDNAKNIWKTLLQYDSLDTEFYFSFTQNLERNQAGEKSEELLCLLKDSIYEQHPNNFNLQITVLKHLLKLKPNNEQYREELVNVYRKKYKSNPKLEDFIRMSNLSQNWRNVNEAISDFEKHIAFSPNSFVYHNKWGIGRIKETTHRYLCIDFAKKRNHQMDIGMAVSSLEPLPKNHFRVLSSVLPKEKLREKILSDPLWTLTRIVKSLGSANMKTIKSELTPQLLTEKEWNSWSLKARKHFANNLSFKMLSNTSDQYTYSNTPIGHGDKVLSLFRMEEKFVGKAKCFKKSLKTNSLDDNEYIDAFWQMFEYCNAHLKTKTNTFTELPFTEDYVHALFICNDVCNYMKTAQQKLELSLATIIPELTIKNLKTIIQTLQITDYKNWLFILIKDLCPNWKELYIELIPHHYTTDIVKLLEKEEEYDFLKEIYISLQQNCQSSKNAFIWFTVTQHSKKWLEDVDVFKIYADIIKTAILITRDIQNKHNTPQNKRIMQHVEDYLFTTDRITTVFKTKKLDDIQYLYSLLSQLSDIIPSHILAIREIIEKRFPDFEFNDGFDIDDVTSSTGFLTLEKSYKKKQKELQHLHEIEVPENSKEIEKARSFGDLKENAEYKAALEHQEMLNTRAALLKQELEQAKIFKEDNLSTDFVSFGTRIIFENVNDKARKEFTILGPWESSPEKNIISYLSPIGKKLYKRKLNELCSFTINDKEYNVKIKEIHKAKL